MYIQNLLFKISYFQENILTLKYLILKKKAWKKFIFTIYVSTIYLLKVFLYKDKYPLKKLNLFKNIQRINKREANMNICKDVEELMTFIVNFIYIYILI